MKATLVSSGRSRECKKARNTVENVAVGKPTQAGGGPKRLISELTGVLGVKATLVSRGRSRECKKARNTVENVAVGKPTQAGGGPKRL